MFNSWSNNGQVNSYQIPLHHMVKILYIRTTTKRYTYSHSPESHKIFVAQPPPSLPRRGYKCALWWCVLQEQLIYTRHHRHSKWIVRYAPCPNLSHNRHIFTCTYTFVVAAHGWSQPKKYPPIPRTNWRPSGIFRNIQLVRREQISLSDKRRDAMR